MNYSEEDKEYILKNFLKNIKGISDKSYQERVWIRGEGPECDDFGETVNYFFDYCSILETHKEFGLTETQNDLLKKFRDCFEAFSDNNYWSSEYIDNPEWTKITEMAKEVLKAFNYPALPRDQQNS